MDGDAPVVEPSDSRIGPPVSDASRRYGMSRSKYGTCSTAAGRRSERVDESAVAAAHAAHVRQRHAQLAAAAAPERASAGPLVVERRSVAGDDVAPVEIDRLVERPGRPGAVGVGSSPRRGEDHADEGARSRSAVLVARRNDSALPSEPRASPGTATTCSSPARAGHVLGRRRGRGGTGLGHGGGVGVPDLAEILRGQHGGTVRRFDREPLLVPRQQFAGGRSPPVRWTTHGCALIVGSVGRALRRRRRATAHAAAATQADVLELHRDGVAVVELEREHAGEEPRRTRRSRRRRRSR